jgi:signal peptidase I
MPETIKRLRRNRLFELAFTIAIALGLALSIQAYAVKPYRIPSGSMEPTLDVGQRVLVNRFAHRLGESPHVGDIVVFMPPATADEERCGNPHQGGDTKTPCGTSTDKRGSQAFIKRVVAVAGDTIAIRDGRVIRNGVLAHESFITPCGGGSGCNLPNAVRVPSGTVFVMGDNRGNSDDSRFWGPVPVSAVIGKAFVTYWPPQRLGGL